MILVELYLVKSVVAWAATIKGVQLSIASADETFKEVRRKTAHIHATLHNNALLDATLHNNALLDGKLPEDVRQAAATVQSLLQDFDDILQAGPARSALTSLPRKLNEAEELQALEEELNAALERLRETCTRHGISIDDDISPPSEPPEDFSPDPNHKPAPPGADKQRPPEQEVVDSIIKQKKERKKIQIPGFIRSYIPTWEMLGYRCRTSKF